jgi:hypothetical protein
MHRYLCILSGQSVFRETKAAISIGLARPSKKTHRCLDYQWHHWKSLGDCLWTSGDITGSPKAASGSPTSLDIGGFSCSGPHDLYWETARSTGFYWLRFSGSRVNFWAMAPSVCSWRQWRMRDHLEKSSMPLAWPYVEICDHGWRQNYRDRGSKRRNFLLGIVCKL